MVALTPKQKKFVKEYRVDLNATQAAIRAGYSQKTAYSQGQRLLKNVEIQEAIQREAERQAERTDITSDKILYELYKIGMSDAGDEQDSHLKFSNKIKALELAGKHLGMFDKKEQAEDNIPDDGFLDALKGEATDTWQD